jgi:peptide/nickel transport system substrate-binding protein
MAVALAMALAGCGRAAPVASDTAPLELSVPVDIETFDPRYALDVYSNRATRLVHAGLVGLDPDTLAPVPCTARSWRWKDALTLHIELRDDVRFHSGAPLRPEDVVATIAALQSPAVASRNLRVVEAIAHVEVTGPHAVDVVLARPHATLLTDLELPILRADQAAAPPDPDGALDGLGPYRVARSTRGDVLLEPADGSAFPRPAHAVVIRTVHDDNARALRLLAGKSDVALNVQTLAPALAAHGVTLRERPGASISYLIARLDRGPLADVRTRRAISLAIDRAGLATTIFEGHADAASTIIPPALWAHTDLGPIPFDPATARALLASSAGAGLHASLLTSTDRIRVLIGRAVAQELDDVGADVEVTPLELGTMLARINAGDFEMALLSLPEFTEPNVLRNYLHGSLVPPAGNNREHVSDPALDALLDRGDASSDQGERRAIYAEVEAKVREGVYLVPLWHEHQLVATSARAAGFQLTAEGRWIGLAGVK